MNLNDLSQQAPFGFLLPPFNLLRIPRDYRGAPLSERIGGGKLLALTVSNSLVEPALVRFSKGEWVVTPQKSFATADWRIDPQAVSKLKAETGARYLAVSYVRSPEQNQLFLCTTQLRFRDELHFHISLSLDPKKVFAKAKDGCSYRGIPHPESSIAIVTMVDPAWDITCQKAAAAADLQLLRTELSILKMANIGLADERVRAGATLLILDYSQALLVASTAAGAWDEPRLRDIKGEQNGFNDFVEKVVRASVKEPHQKRLVVLDTKTSGNIDVQATLGALQDFTIESFQLPTSDRSQFHNLALCSA
jgi:hypothetical protein